MGYHVQDDSTAYGKKAFTISAGHFVVMFPNGIKLSVANRDGNYTEDRDLSSKVDACSSGYFATDTVEVMVSRTEQDDPKDHFFGIDQVTGHVRAPELAGLMGFLARVKTIDVMSKSLKRLGIMYQDNLTDVLARMLERG